MVTGHLITELPAAQPFDVIIGMDIITHGDFSMTNVGGKTWVSSRVPSYDSVDYVVEATGCNSPALTATPRVPVEAERNIRTVIGLSAADRRGDNCRDSRGRCTKIGHRENCIAFDLIGILVPEEGVEPF
jgi:hypothetical protein